MSLKSRVLTGSITGSLTKATDASIFGWALNKKGVAVAAGAIGIASAAPAVLKAHNKANMGPVTYDGPDRMTHRVTSGAVQDAMQISGGDPEIFSELMEPVVQTRGVIPHALDDYGANAEMISALYNMGGR